MPEGDSVHAHAAKLSPLLIDKPLVSVHSRGVEMRGLRGCKVTKIEALGKHLLLTFDEGTAVRVHLGINGGWRTLASASQAALGQAELALVTAERAFVCKARTIRMDARPHPGRHARADAARPRPNRRRAQPRRRHDACTRAALRRAHHRRAAADPSGGGGHRQRLQVRAAVLARAQSLDARRCDRRRDAARPVRRRRALAPRQCRTPAHDDRGFCRAASDPRAVAAACGSTTAGAAPVIAAGPPSSDAVKAQSCARPTGARPVSRSIWAPTASDRPARSAARPRTESADARAASDRAAFDHAHVVELARIDLQNAQLGPFGEVEPCRIGDIVAKRTMHEALAQERSRLIWIVHPIRRL